MNCPVEEPQVARRCLDVSLICMPFGYIDFPFIGLSSLKASLSRAGFSSRVNYYNLRFADLLGPTRYNEIAVDMRFGDFIGDWLFSGEVFEQSEQRCLEFCGKFLPRDAHDGLLEIRALVAGFLEECLTDVLAQGARIVGFTLLGQQMCASLALAKKLKQADPSIRTLLGGSCAEGMMGVELVRQFDMIDAVVSGEGEEVLPMVATRFLADEPVDDLMGVYTASNIDGLETDEQVRITPVISNMDELPYPDHDDFYDDLKSTSLNDTPFVSFETSRGCWWGAKKHCKFCGLNRQGIAYRSKTANRALDEMRYLKERYKVNKFFLTDDILNMKYFQDFLPGVREQHPDIQLNYEAKANLTRDQIAQLAASGVVWLQIGIESLSTPILHLMDKGVTGIRNVQTLKWCLEYGITASWNLLYGFPGEREAEYDHMAARLPLLSHLRPPTHTIKIVLKRFSPYFRQRATVFRSVRPSPEYSYIYPFADSVLENLAFDFSYELDPPRDAESYTAPLLAAAQHWNQEHESSALVFFEHGSNLIVFDLRPDADEFFIPFSGSARIVYRECDHIRTARDLHRSWDHSAHGPITFEQVESLLGAFVARGLMYQEGELLLSLATPISTHSFTERQLTRFAEKITASSRGEKVLDVLGLDKLKLERKAAPRLESPI